MKNAKKPLILSTVVLLIPILVGCQTSRGFELHPHNTGGTPPTIGTLPPGLAKKIETAGTDKIAFVTLYDIKTGKVKLLLRNDPTDKYKVLKGKAKERFLNGPKQHISTSSTKVETVQVNPNCQIITINGSAEVICQKAD